jgi:drug/metabolite transporter (DMT)-like permease
VTGSSRQRLEIVGILLAVFCCLAWGAADFLGGSASKGRPALLVVLLAQAFGLLTAMVAAISWGVTISASSAIAAGAAGICGAVAFIAFYRALTLAPMGVAAPLVGTSVVIPVTFGALHGQWPPALGMVGLVVAGVGALLALGVRSPSTHIRLTPKVTVLCLIAFIGFGGSVTLFAGSAGSGWVGPTLIMRAISVSTLGFVAVLRWRQGRQSAIDGIRGIPWVKVSASGILDVLGNVAFALAVSRVPLLPVAILSGMYPLATAALAWLLIGERLTSRQRWGGGAAVFGAALMAAS